MKATTSAPTVSFIDVSTYVSEKCVSAEYYANLAGTAELREDLMFRAPQFRHHVGKDESNVDVIQQAVTRLVERHGPTVVSDVDILLEITPV